MTASLYLGGRPVQLIYGRVICRERSNIRLVSSDVFLCLSLQILSFLAWYNVLDYRQTPVLDGFYLFLGDLS